MTQRPGLAFWKQVVDAGNFVPVIATGATVDSAARRPSPSAGTTTPSPTATRREADSGQVIDVAIPASGPYGGVYVQGISAYAPHPNAAKLWEEYLYSDEGQNAWLSGYCYPARFEAMKAAGTLNADSLAKLPDATGARLPDPRPAEALPRRSSPTRPRAGTRSSAAPPVQASAAP